jgi:putative inorganic carbon (HCO3(-)) transporter
MDWAQLILLAVLSPLFLFPSPRFLWVFLAVPIFWIARWVSNRTFFARSVLDWPIAIIGLSALGSTLGSPEIQTSLVKICGLVFGILMFYALQNVLSTGKTLRLAMFSFIGLGAAIAIFSLLGMQWPSTREPITRVPIDSLAKVIPRFPWKFPGAEDGFNANAIAGTLLLFVPIAAVLLLLPCFRDGDSFYMRGERKYFCYLFTVVLIIMPVLFLTQSIESWIALVLSVGLVGIPRRWKIKTAILVLALGAASALLVRYWKGPEDVSVSGRLGGRATFWSLGLQAIKKHPVFGIGMNRFRLNPIIFYHDAHAHNQLIHTGAELGLPAMIAYVALLLLAGYMCWVVWRDSKTSPWLRAVARALAASQLAFFIFGIGDAIPLGAKTGIFFWVSLSFIAAAYNMTRENR